MGVGSCAFRYIDPHYSNVEIAIADLVELPHEHFKLSHALLCVLCVRSPDLYDRGTSYPKQIWICLNTLEKKYP